MGKYEYIGKREIVRRVSALGYPVASGKLCIYSKFEGAEWLESPELKITVQRGGDLAADHTDNLQRDHGRTSAYNADILQLQRRRLHRKLLTCRVCYASL